MRNFVTVVCHTFETLSIATRVVKSERAVYVTRSMYARRERVPSRVVGFTHVSYYLPFELDAIEPYTPIHARTHTRAHVRDLRRHFLAGANRFGRTVTRYLRRAGRNETNRRVDFDENNEGACRSMFTVNDSDLTSSLRRVPYGRGVFSAPSRARFDVTRMA